MTQRRLTIVQILPALESGGTERGVLEVAKAIVEAGHRSLVISKGGRLVPELLDGGSEHFTRSLGTKSPFTLRHLWWLRRFLQEQSVDVIDFHSRMPGWITLAAWRSLPPTHRPALVSTVHGLHSVSLYSSVMCRGEHVVAVSNSVRDYVRRNYSFVPEDRLHVIHRGIDSVEFPRGYKPDEQWQENFFRQFPLAKGRLLLTLAGRISRLKGHSDFLHLLAKLKARGIPVHGLIVGDTDPRKVAYRDEMESLASSPDLTNIVTFTGHRTDIRDIFAISSVVMSLSSTPESFGRTVAEALSIGTPVVGYDHGGVSEILAAQFPFGAVNLHDMESLTDKTTAILHQPSDFVPLRNAFEKSAMLTATLQLYQAAASPIKR